MELSKLPFTLSPQNTVSDLSIAPYFPFARVVPVDQTVVVESETHVEAVITLAPIEGAWPFCSVCGENSGRLHMYGTRRVRDLNLAHARVHAPVRVPSARATARHSDSSDSIPRLRTCVVQASHARRQPRSIR